MRLWGNIAAATLALVLAFSLALHAQADALADYRAGIEAFDQGRWQDVVAAMRRAIDQDPQAGSRVKIYGMRLEVYLPYYHLGYALDELGDCPAALEAWQQAEAQGAVRGKRLRELRDRRDACQQRVETVESEPPPTVVPPPPVIEPNIFIEEDTPPVASEEPPVEDSRPSPGPAATVLEERPEPVAAEPQIVEVVDEEAVQTPNQADELVEAPPRRPQGPPQELRAAAVAFFSGEPQKALDILDSAAFDDPWDRRVGLLLIAASRHAVYRAGGGEDLLRAVLDDLERYRSLPGAREPGATWFSPSFRRLFSADESSRGRQSD